MQTYLFVYGTLMRGECREDSLAGQEYLGPAETAPEYRMFNVGEYPALVASTPGLSVTGELWRVDESKLAELDEVEEVDEGLYVRQPVRLQPPHDALAVQTYVYLQEVDGLPDIGRDWRHR